MELKETIEKLGNEIKVIGKLCDVLKYSSFSGHMAQDVAIGQMYLQGLHEHMKQELAKLEASAKTSPVVEEKTVETVK